MPKVASGYGPDHRVNIVKKVKVDGAWNFYPAVVESNGKLKDKVRIKGTVEVHPEGVYSNRENPRLCRGGSRSLTIPGVHPETSST